MNGWNRDGDGHVKVSPVVDWKTATPLNKLSHLFLRVEFGDADNLSALQFSLTAKQAIALSQQLAEDAHKMGHRRTK